MSALNKKFSIDLLHSKILTIFVIEIFEIMQRNAICSKTFATNVLPVTFEFSPYFLIFKKIKSITQIFFAEVKLLPVCLFSISLFRSLFLLVIIGAQLFDHFFGLTRCRGMADGYLSRLINNDKAGDTQYLPFVSQFGVQRFS